MTSRPERPTPTLRPTTPAGPDVVMTMFGATDVASLRAATTPELPALPRAVTRQPTPAVSASVASSDIASLPEHAVTLLRELVESQGHAVDVLHAAAELAKSPALSAAFMANAEVRRGHVVILRGLVLLNDGSVAEGAHTVGPLRRLWLNARRLFGGDDALAVIAGEEHQAVLRAYERALGELDGTTAHGVVMRQYVEMQEQTKGLEELTHALGTPPDA